MEIHQPNGRVIVSDFPMFNFVRDVFDEWLCLLAQEYGASFRDGCRFKDFTEIPSDSTGTSGSILVTLETNQGQEQVRTKYLVDGTGMRPVIRRQLRPSEGFQQGSTGATLNYYFTADGDLEPHKLYQFWNIDFNNQMFTWVYNKTLDDGQDYWVVGTGYDTDIHKYQEAFFDHIKDRFNLRNLEIVKKEGYSSSKDHDDDDRIWLGERNILMVGDAAGLIDLSRGVGMDAAALSGRLTARAISQAEATGKSVAPLYARHIRRLVAQTQKNQSAGISKFQNNTELQDHLNTGMLKMALNMPIQNFLNRFRSAEHQVMLP